MTDCIVKFISHGKLEANNVEIDDTDSKVCLKGTEYNFIIPWSSIKCLIVKKDVV